MKRSSQLFCLFWFGIIVAVFIYPVLHEIGHMIAIILMGMEVKEITLWPIPTVLCQMSSVNSYDLMIIAIMGNIFPYLVIMNIKHKNFWLWYMAYLIKGIVLFSNLLTIISVLCYPYFYIQEDDVTSVIIQYPSLLWVIFPYILSSIYLFKQMKKEQLLNRCCQYVT